MTLFSANQTGRSYLHALVSLSEEDDDVDDSKEDEDTKFKKGNIMRTLIRKGINLSLKAEVGIIKIYFYFCALLKGKAWRTRNSI